MRACRSVRIWVGALALSLCIVSAASSEVTFEWVVVGDEGNPADPASLPGGPCEPDDCVLGIGIVDYAYRIAKHEVTNGQYAEFLNAVASTDPNDLYYPSMGTAARGGITRSGSDGAYEYAVRDNMGNKPVLYITFYDAMRFVNWLHNGQPTGAQDASTTENGVYTISDGLSETRAANAKFFIPNENEWYKAAYYQPSADGGDSDNYWLYPTASNAAPTTALAQIDGDISNPGSNVVNYDDGAIWNGQVGMPTTVGSAGPLSESYYGTADQGGNVWEWNETLVSGLFRVHRGGAFNLPLHILEASHRDASGPHTKADFVGFRVAAQAPLGDVPAVSEWGLAVMAVLVITGGTLAFRRSSVA